MRRQHNRQLPPDVEPGQGASVFEATTRQTVVIALDAARINGSRAPSSNMIQKPVSKANVVLAHDGRGSITPSENTDECSVQLEVRRNPCGDQAGGGCRCLRAIPRGSSARVVSALGLTRFDCAPLLQMLPCPARRLRTWTERGSVRFDHRCWSSTIARHLLQRLSSAEGRQSNGDQCGTVNELEHDGQMDVDHLADVCHEKVHYEHFHHATFVNPTALERN